MTVATYYTYVKPAAGREVFGLHVAVENWLKAWFQYGTAEQFHFLIAETTEWERILEIAKNANLDSKRLVRLDRRMVRENFTQLTTVFRLSPDPQQLLWQREMLAGQRFNFCGLAHAISGLEAGSMLEQYCLSPSVNTDAIVCPSRAVQSAIQTFWDTYSEYLHQRFGAQFKCPVQLPIIPLGIDGERFATLTAPKNRKEQRDKLGLSDDDIVLLWVGRLSLAIKAHPLAMFQAAERAAELSGAKVHLVMFGYFMPVENEAQFRQLAGDFCSKVKVTFVAGYDARFPDGLWAAGDIFLSLVDNIQESFGLTPLEAMAAGLPRVISDWNGYRDCVQDGEDGYLVPTTQPPPGNGRALSELLLSGRNMYGGYLSKSALTIAVDQYFAAETIALLINDKEKRKMIADKARKRVLAEYNWKHLIPAYEALWNEMSSRRKAQAADNRPKLWPAAYPQVPDPYTMYATYPSKALNKTDKLSVVASANEISKTLRHEVNVLALDLMATSEETTKLINHIANHNHSSIANIFNLFSSLEPERLWRTLAWLVKLGILRIQKS